MKGKVWIVVVGVIVVLVVVTKARSCGGGAATARDQAAQIRGEVQFEDIRGELAGVAGMNQQQYTAFLQKVGGKEVVWTGWVVQDDASMLHVDMDSPGTDDKAEVVVQVITREEGEEVLSPGDQVEVAGTVGQISRDGRVLIRGAAVTRKK